MDIAIKYEKIDLWDGMYIFKASSIIYGEYDEETDLFETDYNELCVPIDGEIKDEYSYYGNYISKEELLSMYGGLSLQEALEEYFIQACNVFNIAYFDYNEYKLNVLAIPYSLVEKCFVEQKTNLFLDEAKLKFLFTIDDIKGLRKIQNIEEFYEILDDILDAGKKITLGESFENDNYSNDVENKNTSDLSKEEDSSQKITAKNSLILKKEESKLMTLKELRKEVKDVIKGQDKAVNDITRGIIINQLSKNPRHRSHMLIMGPSGTGKTEMINIISKKIGIPCFKADATAYTKDGYEGKCVYTMLSGLIEAADGDIQKAQNGILIVDEIDKKLTSSEDWVGGVDVLNSFLKIMDRDIVEVDMNNRSKIMFDTSNLTIIFMGAFAKLYEEKEQKRNIGFSSTVNVEKSKEKIYLSSEDLIKSGMPPEFLGRISMITNTVELSLEDLVEILYKSKGSAVKEAIEFCNDNGVKLTFTDPAIREIALRAKEAKTGARTLRKLVKECLEYAYDEMLLSDKVKTLKITKETVRDPRKYCAE